MAEDIEKVSSEQIVEQPAEQVEEPKKARKKPHVSFDILKCALVLVLIATVAGALLGVINWVTYVDPEQSIKETLGKEYGVSADAISNVTTEYSVLELGKSKVNAVYDLGGGVRAFYVTASGAYDGTVEYVVCVKDAKIDKIVVYSSGETASIGGNVLKQANLDKYVGLQIANIDTTSEAGSNDAKSAPIYISGATKTSKSVVNALKVTAAAFNSKGGENA
ncbi:MAG: FMN-binding protein [Clostridia bacterium]|nr:FMN-binding protein [Clostridia bacterium]